MANKHHNSNQIKNPILRWIHGIFGWLIIGSIILGVLYDLFTGKIISLRTIITVLIIVILLVGIILIQKKIQNLSIIIRIIIAIAFSSLLVWAFWDASLFDKIIVAYWGIGILGGIFVIEF